MMQLLLICHALLAPVDFRNIAVRYHMNGMRQSSLSAHGINAVKFSEASVLHQDNTSHHFVAVAVISNHKLNPGFLIWKVRKIL